MGNVTDRLVWTIGYGGRSAGEFAADCQAYNITHVIDVRSNPQSVWFPEFSAGLLRNWLPREGLEYVYMGDGFGGRVDEVIKVSADARAYARRPSFHTTLREFRALLEDPDVVPVLMCAERHPHECHRARLVAPALAPEGFLVRHILADGTDAGQDELPLEHHARKLF